MRHLATAGFSPGAYPGLEAWWAPHLGGVTVDASRQVSQLDDLSGRGRTLVSASAALSPLLAGGRNSGNLCLYSEDLTKATLYASAIWTPTSATVNSASTFTFTAQNGQLVNNVRSVVPNRQYRLRFQAKAVSGHTALTLVSTGATVTSQAITLTGTLDQYEYTFTMAASVNGTLAWGLKDTAASGFGQVQLTNCQLLEMEWDTSYLSTTDGVIRPLYFGLPFLMMARGLQATSTNQAFTFKTTSFSLIQPWSLYMLVRPVTFENAAVDYVIDGTGSNASGAILIKSSSTQPVVAAGGSTTTPILGSQTYTAGNVIVLSAVFNGANSVMQINRLTPDLGNAGSNTPGGIQLGSRGADGLRAGSLDFFEAIIRRGADDAQQRDMFQRYLAGVGRIVI